MFHSQQFRYYNSRVPHMALLNLCTCIKNPIPCPQSFYNKAADATVVVENIDWLQIFSDSSLISICTKNLIGSLN
jgi:hypothetical protein